MQPSFEHLQGRQTHHLPGQPILIVNRSFCEGILPNVQPKPSVALLETLSPLRRAEGHSGTHRQSPESRGLGKAESIPLPSEPPSRRPGEPGGAPGFCPGLAGAFSKPSAGRSGPRQTRGLLLLPAAHSLPAPPPRPPRRPPGPWRESRGKASRGGGAAGPPSGRGCRLGAGGGHRPPAALPGRGNHGNPQRPGAETHAQSGGAPAGRTGKGLGPAAERG